MKFSENWLREFSSPELDTEALAAQLSMAGLEVDSVEPAAEPFSGIVAAKVQAIAPHPNADKLKVCTVDAGAEPLQIVCGAPNVAAGMTVPLATVGARMPGGKKIRKGKLRDVESCGMLCSAVELGLADSADGLWALPDDLAAGTDLWQWLALDDQVVEVDLTPNRADCLSVLGVAREVAALNDCAVQLPAINAVEASIDEQLQVTLAAAEHCPRYVCRVVRGFDAKAQTPVWMAERLRRSGLRPISLVVDITNYVLLELGQPMHAFDLNKIDGDIVVRLAEEGEALALLNEQSVKLNADNLVIADQQQALAMAGVMGGSASAVSAETDAILFESAFFQPISIAGKARRFGLHTDSSHRFERGVDHQGQRRAIERATRLLLDIAGGQAGPVVEAKAEAQLPADATVGLRKQRLQRVLGLELADEQVAGLLARLGLQPQTNETGWLIQVPSYRFDLAIEADLVEEIARMHGYDRLPVRKQAVTAQLGTVNEAQQPLSALRQRLVGRGYQEAITYSFVDPAQQALVQPERQAAELLNPISSEMAHMRTSLWPGLLNAAAHNAKRQQPRLRLFETGLRFENTPAGLQQTQTLAVLLCGSRYPEQWSQKAEPADFYDLKADLEALLGQSAEYEAAEHPALHPGQSAQLKLNGQVAGWVGRIHPALAVKLKVSELTLLAELDLAAVTAVAVPGFEPLSRFPAIRRDLALVVGAEVPAQTLVQTACAAGGETLQDVLVFDVYQGSGVETGRKSIALGLILQDKSATLTDEMADTVIARVQSALAENHDANIRN